VDVLGVKLEHRFVDPGHRPGCVDLQRPGRRKRVQPQAQVPRRAVASAAPRREDRFARQTGIVLCDLEEVTHREAPGASATTIGEFDTESWPTIGTTEMVMGPEVHWLARIAHDHDVEHPGTPVTWFAFRVRTQNLTIEAYDASGNLLQTLELGPGQDP